MISISRSTVPDPVVEAAPLERVVQVAGAVRGEHDDRRVCRGDRPALRDRDREVGQKLEQKRFELVVGAIDLVDEQHDPALARRFERGQQRPPDQEVVGIQIGGAIAQRPFRTVAQRLRQPNRQQLFAVVPIVRGGGEIESLVALQPQEPRAEHRGQRARGVGLSDAGVAFEQHGTVQADSTRQGGRQSRIRDVAGIPESLPEIVDVDGLRHRRAFSSDCWESGRVQRCQRFSISFNEDSGERGVRGGTPRGKEIPPSHR
jgi:hypothetical protein